MYIALYSLTFKDLGKAQYTILVSCILDVSDLLPNLSSQIFWGENIVAERRKQWEEGIKEVRKGEEWEWTRDSEL